MSKVEGVEGDSDEEETLPDDSSSRSSGEILDPRAGKVDVVLSQLKFDAGQIAQLLFKNKFAEGSNTKARKTITKVARE